MQGDIWAVPFEKICGFFEALPETRRIRSGQYELRNTRISVFRLPEKKTGLLLLPQTRVLWTGAVNEELERAFCLTFLSAGG